MVNSKDPLVESTTTVAQVCSLCKAQTFTPGCPTCQNILAYNSSEKAKEYEHEDETVSTIRFLGPALVKRNSIFGNYVVASRLIEEGELICTERPLLVGPYGPTDIYPLCLSCYRDVGRSSKCSKCSWPVCGLECEKNPSHADNECPILAKNLVKSKGEVNEYFCIETLRCLLLRDKSAKKWETILKFEAHEDLRRTKGKAQESLLYIGHFIKEKCQLVDYDDKIIDKIVGILSVNTFWGYKDLKRYASILFDNVTLFSHDCDPNTKRELVFLSKDENDSLNLETYRHDNCKNTPNSQQECDQEEDYFTKCGIAIKIHASRSILEGEMITIHYVDVSLPVQERRTDLKDIFYFDCTCNLCLEQLMEVSKIM